MASSPPPATAKALYGYDPSLPLAVVSAMILISISGYTIYQYVRHRTWYLYMLILGALCEFVVNPPRESPRLERC